MNCKEEFNENGQLNYCRWLHLSDIHLYDNINVPVSNNQFLYGTYGKKKATRATGLDTGGLQWYISRNPIQCIVITGDFFFKGNILEDDTVQNIKSFLRELYGICSRASNWGWEQSMPMDRLFWCPGNHDLDRDALIIENDRPVYRKNIIKTVI